MLSNQTLRQANMKKKKRTNGSRPSRRTAVCWPPACLNSTFVTWEEETNKRENKNPRKSTAATKSCECALSYRLRCRLATVYKHHNYASAIKKNSRYSQSIFGNEILKSCHGILGGKKTNTQCKAGEVSGLWSRAVWPSSLPASGARFLTY